MSEPLPAPATRFSIAAILLFSASILAALGFWLIMPAVLVLVCAWALRFRLAGRTDLRGTGLLGGAITISGIAVIVGIGVMMLAVAGHASRESRVSYRCAANLRGIMQSMVVYASDNNDQFPLVTYAPYSRLNNAPRANVVASSRDVDVVRSYFSPPYPQAGSLPANLWLLVAGGAAAPSQFICRSDPWITDPAKVRSDSTHAFDNFQKPHQLSYSVAYPWDADGKAAPFWRNTMDAGLPLLADMAPLQGTGAPKRVLNPASSPADNRTWNSANHAGEGQNVAFADAHAEFTRRPDIGNNNDNIYTMSAIPSRGPAQFGGIPAGTAAPKLTADKSPFDVVFLPVRNEDNGEF